MAQYKLIVILGPDMPGPDAADRAMWERRGVKFIGDGKSAIDYEEAIAKLVEKKSIGPDTVIYVHAHGDLTDGHHTLRLNPMALLLPRMRVESIDVLRALEQNVQAFDANGEPAAWDGSVVISSRFSERIFEDLKEPGAPKLTIKLGVNSDSGTVSLGAASGLQDVLNLLDCGNNIYRYIAKGLGGCGLV
jgi:hypothetical protein